MVVARFECPALELYCFALHQYVPQLLEDASVHVCSFLVLLMSELHLPRAVALIKWAHQLDRQLPVVFLFYWFFARYSPAGRTWDVIFTKTRLTMLFCSDIGDFRMVTLIFTSRIPSQCLVYSTFRIFFCAFLLSSYHIELVYQYQTSLWKTPRLVRNFCLTYFPIDCLFLFSIE